MMVSGERMAVERMMVQRESDGRANDGGREREEVEERMMVGRERWRLRERRKS